MKLKIAVLFTLLTCLLWTEPSMAADWQWSVPVESVTSPETNDHPRAFLWIPPNCQRVRAVVLGQHNMEEEPIIEHPKFRAAISRRSSGFGNEIPRFDALDHLFTGNSRRVRPKRTAEKCSQSRPCQK